MQYGLKYCGYWCPDAVFIFYKWCVIAYSCKTFCLRILNVINSLRTHWWCHVMPQRYVNIGTGEVIYYDGTKLSPEPILCNHDEMSALLQKTFWIAFSPMTRHYLNQWWLSYLTHICVIPSFWINMTIGIYNSFACVILWYCFNDCAIYTSLVALRVFK